VNEGPAPFRAVLPQATVRQGSTQPVVDGMGARDEAPRPIRHKPL
jgi:hypothetical protein